VKDVINTFNDTVNIGSVPDIALNDSDLPSPYRGREIIAIATDKVINYANLSRSRVQQLIDDRASNKTGTPRHQKASTRNWVHHPSRKESWRPRRRAFSISDLQGNTMTSECWGFAARPSKWRARRA
jgi:hypothetical protein